MKHFLLVSILAICLAPSISSGQSNSLVQADPELFPVAADRKMGYIDIHGKIVIPLKFPIRDPNGYFDDNQYFENGLAVVTDDKQGGFIDKTGRFVIQGPYYPQSHFVDGLARVSDSHGRIGFIDKSGKFVIPPQFERAENFKEGLALVQIRDRWGYIDKTGRMVIPTRFTDAESFHNGLAHANIAGVRRGFIDRAGKFLTMPDEVEYFLRPSEGLIAVKVQDKWGFMDLRGKMVIEPQFERDFNEYHEDRYEGLFRGGLAFAKQNGKFGYIDQTGKFVIAPQFDKADHFAGGLARVSVNGKWGLINRRGEFVAAPRFQMIGEFVEDFAVASIDGSMFGYLDRTGKLVITPQFNEADNFSEGLACVKKAVQVGRETTWLWGYIDTSGKFVIKPQFTYHGMFDRGLARQMIFECVCHAVDQPGYRNEWGYIDRTGKFVWKTTE